MISPTRPADEGQIVVILLKDTAVISLLDRRGSNLESDLIQPLIQGQLKFDLILRAAIADLRGFRDRMIEAPSICSWTPHCAREVDEMIQDMHLRRSNAMDSQGLESVAIPNSRSSSSCPQICRNLPRIR
jgi:hypothetical protein